MSGVAAAAALVVAFSGSVGAYASTYEDHALPGAVVAGQPVGGKTRDEVREVLETGLKDVHVELDIDGHTVQVDLPDAGYEVDVPATVDAVFEPSSSAVGRLAGLVSPPKVELQGSVNEDAPRQLAQQLPDEVIVAAKDGAVAFNAETGAFEVTDPRDGLTLPCDAVIAAAQRAAQSLAPVTQRVAAIPDTPVAAAPNAPDVSEAATKLIAPTVTVKGRSGDVTASADVKASWVEIPQSGDRLGKPTISRDLVAKWVDEQAEDAGADAVDGVRAVTQSGTELSTPVLPQDGYKVSNAAAITDGIVSSLNGGGAYSGEFKFDRTPKATMSSEVISADLSAVPYTPAPGEHWVDVDLKQNHAFLFEGTKQVGDPLPFVPGDPRMPTPTGTFHVMWKKDVDRMRGTDWNDEPYDIPDVHWVTYFTEAGHAFHEASWMDHFGWSGGGGSHGCLNMPTDAAKAVFDWMPEGTAVVIH